MLHDMKDASSPVKLVILLQCLQHTDSLVTQSASTDNATYNNKKVYECHTGVAGQSSCPFPPTPKPTLHQQSLPTPYLQLFPSHASRFAQINRRLTLVRSQEIPARHSFRYVTDNICWTNFCCDFSVLHILSIIFSQLTATWQAYILLLMLYESMGRNVGRGRVPASATRR